MLEVRQVSKSYEGNAALRDVSLTAEKGRVLALCGENGAGKSTLMKILSGVIRPDHGEILLDGRATAIESPLHAIELGVRAVYQELSLLPHISVAENILLGRTPHRGASWIVDWGETRRRAAQIVRDLGFDGIDVRSRTSDLPVSTRQIVEICKALAVEPKILILDEPTSVLSSRETTLLFQKVRALAAAGTTILYISHRLDEIFEISDDVVVLKDGAVALSAKTAGLDRDTLIRAMVGRSLAAIYPVRRMNLGRELLKVRGLSRARRFEDVSFEVRAGEIVGMFGLVGSGRTDVARAIFGAEPAEAGEVFVDDRRAMIRSPADAMANGMGMITEDRKRDGLALDCSVVDNGGLASMPRFSRMGVLNRASQRAEVARKLEELSVRPRGAHGPVRRLSGGNQQKVVLAKWMLVDNIRILIVDEPTRGVDIATKVEIYRMIAELADAGRAILLISSDMPEVLGLSDRLLIMRSGRLVGTMSREAFDMEAVFALAAGVDSRGEAA